MKNRNYLNLTKQVLASLIKDKGIIITSILIFIINITIGCLSIWILKFGTSIGTWLVWEITQLLLFNSFVLGTLCILAIAKIFSNQFYEKVIALEKHVGYSNKQVYFSRVFAFIIFFSMIMIGELFINFCIFWFSINDQINIQIFFISIGWNAVFGLIISSITLIISLFLKTNFLITLTLILNGGFLILVDRYDDIFPTHYGEDLGQQHYPWTHVNYINQKQNIQKVFANSDELKAIRGELLFAFAMNEGNETTESTIGELLMGPRYWKDLPPNWELGEYHKMVLYFQNIFITRKDFGFSIRDVSFFEENRKLKILNFNPYLNFLKEKNVEYLPINDLFELFLKNFFIKEAVGISGQWQNIYDKSVYDEKAEELYTNPGEFFFFHVLNKMLVNSNNPLLTDFEKWLPEIQKGLKDAYHSNLFNPVGHLSSMFFGNVYGDNWVYYEMLNSDLEWRKKSNLKILTTELKDGTKHYEFKKAIWVEIIYVSYVVVVALIIYVGYFPFKVKISR